MTARKSKAARPAKGATADANIQQTLDEMDPANHFPLRTLANYTELAELLLSEQLRALSAEPTTDRWAHARWRCRNLEIHASAVLSCVCGLLMHSRRGKGDPLDSMGGMVEKNGRLLFFDTLYASLLNWRTLAIEMRELGMAMRAGNTGQEWPKEPFTAFGRTGSSCVKVISNVGDCVHQASNMAWPHRQKTWSSASLDDKEQHIVIDAGSPNIGGPTYYEPHPLFLSWQKQVGSLLAESFPEQEWPTAKIGREAERTRAHLECELDTVLRRIGEAKAAEKKAGGAKDLMTTWQVLSEYYTNRATLLRRVKANLLTVYPGKTKKSTNRYSRTEIERQGFTPREKK
jgi:hypothetical protein